MRKLTLNEIDVRQRRVWMRVDYNVPLSGNSVADDSRLSATLPTLKDLHGKGARVVMASHLGRPKGKPDPKYSLRPVAEYLSQMLRCNGIHAGVGFCPEVVGGEAERMSAALAPGSFLLLENLRFDAGEEKNDPTFAEKLSRLGEVYVDDAFGAAHRAHASTVGVTRFFQTRAAGLLMERELEYLGCVLAAHEHPFVVILGGAKVSDKLPVIENLARRADSVLIGGAMAYTFLAAQNQPVGDSLVEHEQIEVAGRLLRDFSAKLVLPVDHVVSTAMDNAADARAVNSIPAGLKAFDIGPETRIRFAEIIAGARMVFWNGPMGVFEHPPFNAGTLAVAKAVALCDGTTVAGGGDSVAALHAAGVADQLTHISTGGGASLEFLAGDSLPGVEALSDAPAQPANPNRSWVHHE